MFNTLRRFIASLTAVILLGSIALPALTAYADNSGTLNVVVSPAAGSYEVLDDATGAVVISARAGSQGFTIPAGDYRVNFLPLAGYTTPTFEHISLLPGGIVTVTGLYVQNNSNSGTLHVVVSPNSATFEVKDDATGATVISTRANSQNFTLPYGDYVTEFKPLGGYTTPAADHFTLDAANPEHTSTGNYTAVSNSGTLTVNVSPATGRYEIRDDATGAIMATERAGSGAFTFPNGDYLVDFKDILGYVTPADAHVTLDAAHTAVIVDGTYTVVPVNGTVTVNVSPATGTYEIRDNATGAVVLTQRTGSGNYTLPFGDYVAVFGALNGYQTPANQAFTLNLANPSATINGNYNTLPSSGSVIVNVTNQNGVAISDADWTLRSCTGATLATCTLNYSNSTQSTALLNVPAGTYGLFFNNTPGYSGAAVLSLNPQVLTSGNTITFDLQYIEVAQTGTVQINMRDNLGALVTDGRWNLAGVTPQTGTATQTVVAAVGNYSVTAVIPAGNTRYSSVSVSPSSAQALANGATLTFDVTYTLAPVTTGTINVVQNGGLGTVTLTGPSPATIVTSPYANATAATGSYTLAVAAPAGFVVTDVRDQNNNVMTSPYTQALVAGGTITYTVNYSAAPTTATLSITTTGALGSVTVNGTALGTYDGTNALTTTVSVGAINTISFGSVATFTTPANIVIAANTLVPNSTTSYVGNYIPTANAATVTVTTAGALGAVSLNGNLLGTYDGITPISAIIDVTLANTLSFGAVAGFTTPANIVIAANTLAAGSTTAHVGTYVAIGSNTTINVTQVGGTGTVTLTGPSAATINTASYTDVSATAGSYTVAVTAPLGTVLVDVRDAGNNVLVAPYTQALAANGTIDYTVTYAPVLTSGTVTVNQAGTTGTVTLLGPTPANVTTATYTNAQSGTGSYTLGAITAPAGFNLVDVRDQNNNVLAAPYTQALSTGATIVYNVNYAAIPATGTLTVTQVGATGTVNLFGPSPATIVASPYSNAAALTGNYTLSLTTPAGFILVDVRNGANAVILPPYAQTLAANGTIAYTVNYAPVVTSGTVRVNQIGGTGSLDLIGPSPAYVITTPYSNAQAGTGSYTLIGITAPNGTALVDVRDGNNNVIVAPYTQALATGGVITYNVNYSPATAFTLIKSANVASVNDNGIVTYTITLVRNTNVAGSISATLSDTVTGTGAITGANGGSALYIPNSGTCSGVTCSGQQIALAPITVTLDNPGSTATLTYQVRAFNASVVGASSVATNTVTATIAGFPTQTATSPVSLVANAAPVGPTNGSTGTSSSSGGSGGYKLKKGDMKLDLQKLVSLDGVNFVTPDAGKSLALAMPENKATRLYTKLLMNVQGDVSATNIKLRHFFDIGRSDMTADELENLVGAHVDNRGLLTVDKVKVGETATLTYSVLVHENGRNINPAVDGLELVSFGSNLPPMQDGLTYLGLGSQVKTYLYAGSVPANADQTQGEVVLGNGSASDLGAYLALDVRANKPVANIGDTVTFTIALRNLTDGDMTNVFIDHTFDTDAFEMADAYGARTDANGIHWKQPLLRSGQEVNLSFKLLVKNSAPVGAMVTGQTRVLVSEYEGIPPVENAIRIGAAGQTMQLAQTGPAGILGLLMVLSALAALAHRLLRNASYLRNKRLALQSL